MKKNFYKIFKCSIVILCLIALIGPQIISVAMEPINAVSDVIEKEIIGNLVNNNVVEEEVSKDDETENNTVLENSTVNETVSNEVNNDTKNQNIVAEDEDSNHEDNDISNTTKETSNEIIDDEELANNTVNNEVVKEDDNGIPQIGPRSSITEGNDEDYNHNNMFVFNVRYRYYNGDTALNTFVEARKIDEYIDIDVPVLDGYTPDFEEIKEQKVTKEFIESLAENNEVIWYEGNNNTKICQIYIVITYMPAESSYKIHHLRQTLDGSSYELYKEETITENVRTGDIVSFTGHELTEDMEGFTLNTINSTRDIAVEKDGSTVVDIYYDRNIYYVYYDTSGGTYYEPQPVLYGAEIPNVENPTRDGYRFINWTWYNEQNGEALPEKPSIMDTHDVYAVANWRNSNTNYSISYYIENANDDGYTAMGEITNEAVSENYINLDEEENDIINGLQQIVGSEEYMYYSYNKQLTLESNTDENLTINGDGTTVIKVYFTRNVYTLTLHLGTKQGNNYQIYYNSSLGTRNVQDNITLNIAGKEYSIDDGGNYTITAKYGQNIRQYWPTPSAGLYITPSTIRSGFTTYYPYAWLYKKNGSNSYTSQVSGIYTMNKDIIIRSGSSYEGANFYLQWNTQQANYTVHYMFESLNDSGEEIFSSASTSDKNYYRGYKFIEDESLQVKSSSNSMSYKTIDGFHYNPNGDSVLVTSGSGFNRTYDIYLYYLRDVYTLGFYSVNGTVLPDFSGITLEEGISIDRDNGVLNVKYGTKITSLKDVNLDFSDYTASTLGTKPWKFDKWYKDDNFTLEVDWENEIITENTMLYANWIPPVYNIIFDTNNGDWTETSEKYKKQIDETYMLQTNEGNTLTPPSEPTRVGYNFDGWYYIDSSSEEEVELKYLFSDSQSIYDDLLLTAKWNVIDNVSYTVKYLKAKYTDGNELITDIAQYSEEDTLFPDKVIEGRMFDEEITEQAIPIESSGIEIYVPLERSQTIILNNNNFEENVIYFFYNVQDTVDYTIYYVKDTGKTYDENNLPPQEEWLQDPETKTITAPASSYVEENSPIIGGYQAMNISQSLILIKDESKNVIIFYYSEDVTQGDYKISIYLDKNNYEDSEEPTYDVNPDYTVSGKAPVGRDIFATEYKKYINTDEINLTGYELDTEKSDVLAVVTSSDEVSQLKLYFNKIVYKVTYHLQGGNFTDVNQLFKEDGSGNYYLIKPYNQTAIKPSNPTLESNEFRRWYTDKGVAFDFNKQLTEDVELFAVWREKTKFTISKQWDDDENRELLRPDSVTVNVRNYGDITIQAPEWKTEIEAYKYDYSKSFKLVYVYGNLAYDTPQNSKLSALYSVPIDTVFENGTLFASVKNTLSKAHYWAVETNIPAGYHDEYSPDTFTITNVHQIKTKTITVEKVWNDDENRDLLRPNQIELELLGNNEVVGKATINDNRWTYTWRNLPVYENSAEIEYTIRETNVPNGYTVTYGVDEETGNLVVTNTHVPEKKPITVKKVWDDKEDQDGKRPEFIKIQLYNRTEKVGEEVELNEQNGWTANFPDLYKYENIDGFKSEIIYSVKEDKPSEYENNYNYENSGEIVITNTHTPEKVNKVIEVIWEDNNDQDGVRPEQISLSYKKNEKTIKKISVQNVNYENQWTDTWSDLDKYENGTEISYNIDIIEDIENFGYEEEYIVNENTITIKLKHTPSVINKTVNVIWDDANNQDGKRPEDLKVKLMADGELDREITISGPDWNYSLENLPENRDHGIAIDYTIELENQIPEYTTTYEQETLTIRNEHTPILTNVNVTNEWDDANNQDGKRPNNFEIQLFSNGSELGEAVTVSAEDYTYNFENLPKYENGSEVKYTVRLVNDIPNYETTYDDDKFVLKHFHEPEKEDKVITKVWRDGSNKDNTRDGIDSVEIQLLADGQVVGTYTLSYDNSIPGNTDTWQYTVKQLDVYKNGRKINYTVKEVEVPEGYGAVYNYNTLTVYNTYPPEINIVVEKIWNDNEDGDGKRAKDIEVQLYADGIPYKIGEQEVGKVTLNEENNWTHTFEFLEKYNDSGELYEYSIEEINSPDYYTSEISSQKNDFENRFMITNSYSPEITTRKVIHKWEDNENQDGIRPSEIKFDLYGDDKLVAEDVSINDENSWSYVWDNLYKNSNHGKSEVNYRLEVKDNLGYAHEVKYDESNQTFTIISKHNPEKISIKANKVWNDANDQDGKRPQEATIELLKNNEVIETEKLNSTNNWEFTFENLDKFSNGNTINYTIQEKNIDENYSVSYEKDENGNTTITNTHNPEVKDLSVQKIWNDDNDRDGLRPTRIKINLLANSNVIGTVQLSENKNWEYEWKNMPVYDNGEIIVYSVEETEEYTGYTKEDVKTQDNKFILTNTHAPELTSKTVKAFWEDDNNRDGLRTESIKVQLYNGTEKIGDEIVLDETNNWTYTWNDLFKNEKVENVLAKSEGKTDVLYRSIEYTVKEVTIPDQYNANYSTDELGQLTITNTHIPNKTSKKVVVKWEDDNNRDAIRPETIEVNLLSNGRVIDTKTISKDNWTYTWENLFVNEEGQEVNYTVVEKEFSNEYSVQYKVNEETKNLEIINTHKPQTKNISTNITWEDDNNRDGLRPENVEVNLLSNGRVIDTKTISKDNWTHTWENIPVFENGNEINYTVKLSNELNNYETKYDGINILNIHKVEKVNKEVLLKWNDNKKDVRPEEIEVGLYGNDELLQTFTLDINYSVDDNTWNYNWTDLYKNDNGKEIVYNTKILNEVPYYEVEYDEDSIILSLSKYEYIIEYYYNNKLDESKTEKNEAYYKDVIDTYTDNIQSGYELEKVETLPLEITDNLNNNVIRVYYSKTDSPVSGGNGGTGNNQPENTNNDIQDETAKKKRVNKKDLKYLPLTGDTVPVTTSVTILLIILLNSFQIVLANNFRLKKAKRFKVSRKQGKHSK